MNIRPRRKNLACCISLACIAMAMQPAHADSAYGVDAILGNAFNTGYAGGQRDPDATPSKHTPTGQLYGVPYARDEAVAGATSGWVEIGILSSGADEKAALFRKYKDPQSGLYLNSFGMTTESDNARFLDITGGGVGNDDQFYSLSVGRYNDWKVKAFYSETPHVFTSTYRNLWSGTGTANLTLNPPLVAGPVAPATAATTDIAIGNAALATPYSELSLIRKKGGIRADMNLQDNWKVFASYSNEKRDGARPFGMVSAGGGGTGGVEIPESIDYDTHDFLAGIQYSDALNSATLQAAASLFRNNVGTMTVGNPMFLNAANGIVAAGGVGPFPRAVFDLYPDNDYYNLKGEYARELPDMMKGRFTGVVSLSQSKQNDNLIPSTSYAGATVNAIAGGAWDTVASLSQPTANLKVDINMADFGLSLKPVDDLDVKGKIRYYETQTNSNYQACNPLTGQFGRLTNDGSGAAMFNALQTNGTAMTAGQAAALNAFMAANGCNEAALASYLVANGLVPAAGNVNIRSIPYAYKQMNYTLGADYQLGNSNSINANYERETLERQHRERAETWEDKIKLGYVNRGLENGTLRLSFENDRLRGTPYISDPYDPFYSASLGSPNTGNLAMTSWIHVNSLHRKFDLADRDQNILNGRFNYMVRPDLDAGVSFQLKTAKYPDAVFGLDGRNKQEQNSLNFDLTWQPSAQMTVSGYYAYQDGKSEQNGIQQNACVVGTTYNFWSDGSISTVPQTAAQLAAGVTLVSTTTVTSANFLATCGTASATSPLYATSRAWNVAQKNQSDTLGLGFKFDFSNMTVLDVNYTYSSNRTKISYAYNPYALGILTSGAPTAAQLLTLGLIGGGFSDLVLTQNVVDASVLVPFTKQSSVRVLGRFEAGRIRDWHYDGVAANPTPGTNQQTYLDSGPQHYRTYVLGVMYQYKM
ncbi:MAG: MtrB/PioB family outer membrane beta-barrel protein [Nitrosomonadales bacterium]|nr:MtrB/PioB family outer membrane beta-barrel protein [Nitrosomonadales bacterium]